MNLYTPRAALFCIRYWNMLLDAVNTSGVTRNDDLITCLKLGPDASEKRVVDMSWSVLKAPFSHNCCCASRMLVVIGVDPPFAPMMDSLLRDRFIGNHTLLAIFSHRRGMAGRRGS